MWQPGGLASGRFGEHICRMSTPTAILIAGVMIAGTMALVFRYELSLASITEAHRFDRWTGKIQRCTSKNGKMDCSDK